MSRRGRECGTSNRPHRGIGSRPEQPQPNWHAPGLNAEDAKVFAKVAKKNPPRRSSVPTFASFALKHLRVMNGSPQNVLAKVNFAMQSERMETNWADEHFQVI